LDRSQPVRGAELIVLSEHVDYWNDIGWKDPYSSHEYSERQSAYAEHFGLRSAYTPQMVVDGLAELVGSDERRAVQAMENAKKAEKIPVSLSSVHFEANNSIALHVDTGPLSSSIAAKSANVLLAIADESDESRVSRGENAGRTLKHVAVLRNLVRTGTVDKTGKFSRDVTIDLRNASPRNVEDRGNRAGNYGGKSLGSGIGSAFALASAISRARRHPNNHQIAYSYEVRPCAERRNARRHDPWEMQR
jgi:hypothetical protein